MAASHQMLTVGRPFLQIPGPTNVPDRVLRAMDRPVPDHRSPEMPELMSEIRDGLRRLFGTAAGEIVIFPGSGSGGWEASIVNVLDPGDRVLGIVNGHFASLYVDAARRLGAEVDTIELRWGDPASPGQLADRLRQEHKAVLVVHNETSTGATSDIGAIRHAIDSTGHEPLLLVDTVSSLGSIDFRFDEWHVDVALTGTQKGLMLPPGAAVLCVSERAVSVASSAKMPRFFYDWRPMIADGARGYFPYTPPTLLLYGMREALRMIMEEGLENVVSRHTYLAEAVRLAVEAWDMELLCRDSAAQSNTLSAVVTGPIDAEAVVGCARELNLALGVGLGPLKGKVFRIGHLGALNKLEVLATVAGTELAIKASGGSLALGNGVSAAQNFLSGV